MNNSQNNVGREIKIDTHAWSDLKFYCKHKKMLTNGVSRDKK